MKDVKVDIGVGKEFCGVRGVQDFCVPHISREFARIFIYEDYISTSGVVAPSNQPTSLTFTSVTSSGYTVSWTASVGGADGYVVFRRTGASPTYTPVDGTTYVVDTVYGDSTCEYFGSAVTFNESGLSAYTEYFYDVFAYNGTAGTYKFLTTSPLENSQRTLFDFGNALKIDLNIPLGQNYKDQAKTLPATVAGDAVKCVVDQSGNNNDATIAASNPILGNVGAFASIDFAGANIIQVPNISLSKNFTIFLVMSGGTVGNKVLYEFGVNASTSAGFLLVDNGQFLIHDGSASYSGGTASVISGDNTLKCLTAYCASTKESLKIDEDGWRLLRISSTTGAVSSTNVLNFNIGARQGVTGAATFKLVRLLVYDRVLTDAERYAVQIYLGQAYNLPYNTVPNTFVTALLDNYIRGSLGASYNQVGSSATISIVSNKLRLTGGVSTFGQYLNYLVPHNGENWKMTQNIKMVSAGVHLLGVSRITGGNMLYCMGIFNTGTINLYNSGSGVGSIGSTTTIPAINTNDELIVTFEKRGNRYFSTVTNSTQGVSKTVEWVQDLFTNINYPVYFSVGAWTGTWDVSEWKIEINKVNSSQNTIILGDSLTAGNSATRFSKRSTEIIKRQTSKNIEAAGWNTATAADIILALPSLIAYSAPTTVVLKIGMNEILNSVPQATYIANMHTIVNTLVAAGIQVKIGNISPSTSGRDATIQAFNAALVTEFPTYSIIDCYTNKVSANALKASMDSGDAVHWNNAGHAQEAADIIAGWPGIL